MIPYDYQDDDLSHFLTKNKFIEYKILFFSLEFLTEVYPQEVLQQDSIASYISAAINRNISSSVAFDKYIIDSICSERF
jgi:hypothetical protein